jgi:dolichyl-phosphate-mannose-protein mannosyltransferase
MMKKNTVTGYGWCLLGIIAVSVFLHVFRVSYPDRPVFDESHFATYAASYAAKKAYFDIHPPLGKAVYGLVLSAYPAASYENRKFIELNKNGGKLEYGTTGERYGSFPFVPLRLLSAFFGVLLPILSFMFLKNLTGRELPALLAAFFVTFETSLLLETRLILLNGMFLALGLLALVLYFQKRPRPVLAGIVLGLALGVKLIAVVFWGPAIGLLLFGGRQNIGRNRKQLIVFSAVAILTFLVIIALVNNLLLPAGDRLNLYNRLIGWLPKKPPTGGIIDYVKASLVELNTSLSGYTTGVDPSPLESSWYEWPVMMKPMVYFPYLYDRFNEPANKLILMGNPLVWLLATGAVMAGLTRVRKFLKEKGSVPLILLFSYLFSLLPYILIVRRTTFLYHYFPALIFAVLLLAVTLGDVADSLPRKNRLVLIALTAVMTVFSFLAVAPFVFGY